MSTCSTTKRPNKAARTSDLRRYEDWKAGRLRGQRASVGLSEKLPAAYAYIDALIEERKSLRSAIVKAVNNQSDANHALRVAYNAIPAGVRKSLA